MMTLGQMKHDLIIRFNEKTPNTHYHNRKARVDLPLLAEGRVRVQMLDTLAFTNLYFEDDDPISFIEPDLPTIEEDPLP